MYHIAASHQPTLPTPEQMSDLGQDFLLRCFERDPSLRPSAKELLEDPWIKAIEEMVRDAEYQEAYTPSSEGGEEYTPSSS
jgi:mitogen-activated protein kinase kinase kinase